MPTTLSYHSQIIFRKVIKIWNIEFTTIDHGSNGLSVSSNLKTRAPTTGFCPGQNDFCVFWVWTKTFKICHRARICSNKTETNIRKNFTNITLSVFFYLFSCFLNYFQLDPVINNISSFMFTVRITSWFTLTINILNRIINLKSRK